MKITQKIIGERLGISQSTVCAVFLGRPFSPQTAKIIAEYAEYPKWHDLLGMTPDEIKHLIVKKIQEKENA